jgi:hypothetical protein
LALGAVKALAKASQRSSRFGETMTESPLVNKWMQQAIDRTRLEDWRDSLLDCLKTRFPNDLTPDVIETINQQPSAVLLRSWNKFALAANCYAEFLAELRR